MGKKQVAVSLRKPPSPFEGSVTGDAAARPARPRSGIDELRPSLGNLCALTVQLPADLASQLLLRCMKEDRDVSNMIADLVRTHLEGKVEDPELTLGLIVRWIRSKVAGLRAARTAARAAA